MTIKTITVCNRCKFEDEGFMRQIDWYDGGDQKAHLCKLCYKFFNSFLKGSQITEVVYKSKQKVN